jgi:pimeloyl-ACP methyl ester carboxylesterase
MIRWLRNSTSKGMLRGTGKRVCILGGIVLVLLAACWVAWVMWGRGLVVFNPQPMKDANTYARRYAAWSESRRSFEVGGEQLDGWFQEKPGAPLIVFCPGRGRDVASYLSAVDSWPVAKLLVNYRGSGRSSGWPSEETVVDDMIRVVETILQETDRNWSQVVLVGNSLGTGVATHIAARRSVGRLILCVPFDSFGACARMYAPDWMVSVLVGGIFRSDLYAPRIKVPVVILAATHDRQIPVEQARRLRDRFADVSYEEFPGGHEAIWARPEARRSLKEHACAPL